MDPRRRATIALVLLVILVPVWLGEFYGRRSRWLEDPAQKEHRAAIEKTIRERAAPSESVLLLGVSPDLYATTGTLPPGRVFVFDFPWFLEVAGDRVLDAVRRDPPKVVLVDGASGIDGQRTIDAARPILDEVHAHYARTGSLGSIEVWEPKPR